MSKASNQRTTRVNFDGVSVSNQTAPTFIVGNLGGNSVPENTFGGTGQLRKYLALTSATKLFAGGTRNQKRRKHAVVSFPAFVNSSATTDTVELLDVSGNVFMTLAVGECKMVESDDDFQIATSSGLTLYLSVGEWFYL
jgi:hypothetical protein